MHAYIHTYIHAYIHTYIHTHIHTYRSSIIKVISTGPGPALLKRALVLRGGTGGVYSTSKQKEAWLTKYLEYISVEEQRLKAYAPV
jgi:hypothetical protein